MPCFSKRRISKFKRLVTIAMKATEKVYYQKGVLLTTSVFKTSIRKKWSTYYKV